MEVQINPKCDEIIKNINKMTETAIDAIKIAQDRASAAETTLVKIKSALSEEINNAYQIGFSEGIKYKNTSGDISDDVSGGTQKDLNDVAKLVLETKN